ncbi:hypothetical protein J6590_000925 [Homalodisca vitripennis]|nr:hypothetical protein J6590_000925 [Homalodisca vitripennis]
MTKSKEPWKKRRYRSNQFVSSLSDVQTPRSTESMISASEEAVGLSKNEKGKIAKTRRDINVRTDETWQKRGYFYEW